MNINLTTLQSLWKRVSGTEGAEYTSITWNFSWKFVGSVVYTLCQWGMLTVLTKLGSPEIVGRYSLGLAVTAPVVMFTNLQLRTVQATDTRDKYTFADYMGLRLVTTGFALTIILIIVLSGSYSPQAAYVIVALGLAKSVGSINGVIYGLFQRNERMDRIAWSLIIKGPLSLLALGMAMWATDSVTIGALALAVACLGVLFVFDIPNAQRMTEVSASFRRERLFSLARLALPLGIVMGLISLNANIPRYFVEWYWGEEQLGYYSALAYLAVASNIVVNALGQSASPRLAMYYADHDVVEFVRLLAKLVGIGAILGGTGIAVAAILGKPLLTLLYRPEYSAYTGTLLWIMAATGVGYMASFLGYGMTAAWHFRAQVPLFGVVTVATATSCAIFVPRHGPVAAAQATLIGAIVKLLGGIVINANALRKLT